MHIELLYLILLSSVQMIIILPSVVKHLLQHFFLLLQLYFSFFAFNQYIMGKIKSIVLKG